MDIKDFILIGGGLLIAAVVAHGFWIAWRSRQEPLRIDIQPDLIPDAMTDMERLRGELPNGGARIVNGMTRSGQPAAEAKQEPLPLLLEPSAGPLEEFSTADRVAFHDGADRAAARRGEPDPAVSAERAAKSSPRTEPLFDEQPARAEVADVALPDAPLFAEKPLRTGAQTKTPARGGDRTAERGSDAEALRKSGSRRRVERKTPERAAEKLPVAEELIILNVIAKRGEPYSGEAIFTALQSKGLKFGDMNIFHRVDPLTKAVHFSIANVVEPGTFDMADMESFHAPGLCLFMQLPGPENPAEAFDDMLDVAGEVVARLGGEISDEQRNRVTPQTVEHYRQRIAEFSRRRMFKRA